VKSVLSGAGRAFLAAFGASLLVFLPGILAAPNLDEMYAVGVSALLASFAAGIKVLQEFVPFLTWGSLLPQPWAAWADAFTRGFLSYLIVTVPGILNAPDLSLDSAKALIGALLVGGITAGLRAGEGLTTKGEYPATVRGLTGHPVSPPPAT
jgi:hypothetical protein